MNKAQGFEFTENAHPVRMTAWGKTVSELFRNSLRGMAELMKPTVLTARDGAKKVTQMLRVEAVDVNTLLVAFLSEVSGLSDIHNLVFTNVTLKDIGDDFLEAELSGVQIDSIENEVKAVSYQDVDIKRSRESGMYETTLEFDI